MSIDTLVFDQAIVGGVLSRGQRNCVALAESLPSSGLDGSVFYDMGRHLARSGLWTTPVEYPDSFQLVFLHHNDAADFEAEVCSRELAVGTVVRYTGEFLAGQTADKGVWVHRSVTKEQPLTKSEAEEILTWLRDGASIDVLPPILGGITEQEIGLEVLSALFGYPHHLAKLPKAQALSKLTEGDPEPEASVVLSFEEAIRLQFAGKLDGSGVSWPPARCTRSKDMADAMLATAAVRPEIVEMWKAESTTSPTTLDESFTRLLESEEYEGADRRMKLLCRMLLPA